LPEQMLNNYDKANRLRSWADLFGFQIEMGRENDVPFIELDGVRLQSEDMDLLLSGVAGMMGMSENDLNGVQHGK